VHSCPFFESLGLGLVSQGVGLGFRRQCPGLGRQGLSLGLGPENQGHGFRLVKTKTMLTCVTFRL